MILPLQLEPLIFNIKSQFWTKEKQVFSYPPDIKKKNCCVKQEKSNPEKPKANQNNHKCILSQKWDLLANLLVLLSWMESSSIIMFCSTVQESWNGKAQGGRATWNNSVGQGRAGVLGGFMLAVGRVAVPAEGAGIISVWAGCLLGFPDVPPRMSWVVWVKAETPKWNQRVPGSGDGLCSVGVSFLWNDPRIVRVPFP